MAESRKQVRNYAYIIFSEIVAERKPGGEKMNAEIFTDVPNELKTIEVDVEKKIFKVNGVPFGDHCTYFNISCDAMEGFKIRMEFNTTVKFASYGMNGRKNSSDTWEVKG
ncbi:MAG: hypothetical protein NC123_17045 [Butyrivibrio sp.]|nr:hypothetical protein [Acetatifactor muris]MCM1561226.1 hypothetical protein [Butyrivibrio sp.]